MPSSSKRIVVKIGTSTLTRNGSIDVDYIKETASDVSKIINQGDKVIIVTSGAIGLGAMKIGLKQKPRDIILKQGLAAIGQGILMNEYQKAFEKHGLNVAQVLLTYDVISERKTYLNLKNSLELLLKMNVVPVINENDVVSIDEIGTKFGDNDLLSALVASKMDADLLIILSDIDGLYTDNPKNNKAAKLIPVVREISSEIEKAAGKSGSSFSSGGMESKIKAAKIATEAGCAMVIANGRSKNIISRVANGEKIGTLFLAKAKLAGKDRWILNAKPKGKILINECAEKVLKEGKSSLLPIGITGVEGNFKAGDVISINDFARGVADLDSQDIDRIKGLKSKDVCHVLGKKCRDEVIRKENIVLI
jgi:glutamate 5-kinase